MLFVQLCCRTLLSYVTFFFITNMKGIDDEILHTKLIQMHSNSFKSITAVHKLYAPFQWRKYQFEFERLGLRLKYLHCSILAGEDLKHFKSGQLT